MFGKISIKNFKPITTLDELLALVPKKEEVSDLYFGILWKNKLMENNKDKITNIILNGDLSNKIEYVNKIANYYNSYILENLKKYKFIISIDFLKNIANELTIKNIIENDIF